jgi:hypothetical protein
MDINMTDKNTIYIVDLEPVETRYTAQWQDHIPRLLRQSVKGFNIKTISGPTNIPKATTPGAFLNFGGTNIYKSDQMVQIATMFTDGSVKAGDHFIYTDAWNPTILQLKYMSELLEIPIKIHGLWHAGNYDKNDFLGRLISSRWVNDTEFALARAIDYNWFASDYHIKLFRDTFGYDDIKCYRTGWPMEYLKDTIRPDYKSDIILFPHRIAPEKQVEIFRDLAKHMPEYEFIICQEDRLSKYQYHTLLSRAKMVFSANLQETLGISCYEGALAEAMPLVPDRLSYTEMYHDNFKYPSEWTESYKSYLANRTKLIKYIRVMMNNYDSLIPDIQTNANFLHESYFSCESIQRLLNE